MECAIKANLDPIASWGQVRISVNLDLQSQCLDIRQDRHFQGEESQTTTWLSGRSLKEGSAFTHRMLHKCLFFFSLFARYITQTLRSNYRQQAAWKLTDELSPSVHVLFWGALRRRIPSLATSASFWKQMFPFRSSIKLLKRGHSALWPSVFLQHLLGGTEWGHIVACIVTVEKHT